MTPRPATDLRPYQVEIADLIERDYAARKPGRMLGVQMSLGKTVSTLTGVKRLLDTGEVIHALIVAPKLVAAHTWPREIDQWEHTRALTYEVAVGPAAQREAAVRRFRAGCKDFLIINRENLPWLYKTLGGARNWPFQLLIYDEATRLSEGKKVTASGKDSEFGVLAKVRDRMDFVVELTGTLGSRGLAGMWGPYYIIDQGRRLGTSKTAFMGRWFQSDFMGYNHTPRPGAEDAITSRVADVTYQLKAADVLDLPEIVNVEHWVDLSPAEKAVYDRLVRDLALEEHDIVAENRAVLAGKLAQFANGSVYTTDEETGVRSEKHFHDHKLDALGRILEETGNENLLIAYAFKFDLARLRKRLPKAVVADEEPGALDAWNRGEIPQLLAHPASIGHGLNLQYGGHHTVWYGLTPSLELYAQFNARLPRPGQASGKCFVHHILARGTFDERLMAGLRENGATQDRITAKLIEYLAEAGVNRC